MKSPSSLIGWRCSTCTGPWCRSTPWAARKPSPARSRTPGPITCWPSRTTTPPGAKTSDSGSIPKLAADACRSRIRWRKTTAGSRPAARPSAHRSTGWRRNRTGPGSRPSAGSSPPAHRRENQHRMPLLPVLVPGAGPVRGHRPRPLGHRKRQALGLGRAIRRGCLPRSEGSLRGKPGPDAPHGVEPPAPPRPASQKPAPPQTPRCPQRCVSVAPTLRSAKPRLPPSAIALGVSVGGGPTHDPVVVCGFPHLTSWPTRSTKASWQMLSKKPKDRSNAKKDKPLLKTGLTLWRWVLSGEKGDKNGVCACMDAGSGLTLHLKCRGADWPVLAVRLGKY